VCINVTQLFTIIIGLWNYVYRHQESKIWMPQLIMHKEEKKSIL